MVVMMAMMAMEMRLWTLSGPGADEKQWWHYDMENFRKKFSGAQ